MEPRDRMRFCPKCGQKYDPYEDNYCSNCGTVFAIRKEKRKAGGGLAFFIVWIFIISPLVYLYLFGECGTVRVAQTIRVYETYAIHIAEIEEASSGDVRPPPYLLAQIESDLANLNIENDQCLIPSSRALYDTLFYASQYFGFMPLKDRKNDNYVYETQWHYLTSLQEYEREMKLLQSCHPFCNIKTVFDIKNSIEYSRPTQRPQPTSTNRPASNSKPTEMPFRPTYPYIVGMLNGGQIDMKTKTTLTNWLGKNSPAKTYYWFVEDIETKADGTMIIELVGMRIPVEEWQKYSDVYPIAGSEIVWRGSVVVHGNSVEIYTP